MRSSNQKGMKTWCAAGSSSGTCVFELCGKTPDNFTQIVLPGRGEKETRYTEFTLRCYSDSIHNCHIFPHVVLFLDSGLPTILSVWVAATATSQQIINQTLDKYTFGVRYCTWCKLFLLKKKCIRTTDWLYSPAESRIEYKILLQKYCRY